VLIEPATASRVVREALACAALTAACTAVTSAVSFAVCVAYWDCASWTTCVTSDFTVAKASVTAPTPSCTTGTAFSAATDVWSSLTEEHTPAVDEEADDEPADDEDEAEDDEAEDDEAADDDESSLCEQPAAVKPASRARKHAATKRCMSRLTPGRIAKGSPEPYERAALRVDGRARRRGLLPTVKPLVRVGGAGGARTHDPAIMRYLGALR
jgi:hypothetical protein